MNLTFKTPNPGIRGHVLLMVTVMLAICLITTTALYLSSSVNSRQNQRNNDYYLAVAAAEAATEKSLSAITTDYRNYGIGYVTSGLNTYRAAPPSTNEASIWGKFDFMDLAGTPGQVEIQYTPLNGFAPLGGQYGALCAFKDRMRILANARARSSIDGVVGSVYQDIEFDRIPIFQFAVFYNILMEIDVGPNFTITGPVHCNTNIYLNPANVLTFNGDLTSSGTIFHTKNPISPHALQGGSVVNIGRSDSGVSTLSLPIGTNNTPAAVQQVLELPPGALPTGSENPLSSMGVQRYYNKADLIITVSNSSVSVTSGRWNSFVTSLSSNEVALFVSTNTSFFNKRENKTIKPIQIDVSKLILWNATNTSIRPTLPLHDVRVIYITDQRTLNATNESGVRLVNGTNLPPQGLTVATRLPLYFQGDFNVPPSAKGTTNTTGSLPASVAADAVTLLSNNWKDTNSNKALSSRVATATTVNAAVLTGIVETTAASASGGVENALRCLEEWTGVTNTYNGSLVCMFPSQVANAPWVNTGSPPDIFNPPTRNWSLDQNFQNSNKLPPATPSLMVLVRANWRTPAAYTTNVMAGF